LASHLTIRCARAFDGRAIERGVIYARQRRVALRRVDEHSVQAVVTGSQRYAVAIALAEPRGESATLRVSCACPRFSDGHHCKHLYAVLVELERAGRLFEVPGLGAIRLARDVADSDLEAEDDSLEEDWEAALPVPPRRAPLRSPTDPSRWLLGLTTLREQAAAAAARDGELLFTIARLQYAAGPVVQLMRRKRLKSGEWAQPRDATIPGHEIRSHPEPDRAALRALLACRSPGDSSSYGMEAVTRRELPEGLQLLVLPVLARTGRLCELVDGRFRFLGFSPEPVRVELRVAAGEKQGTLRFEAALSGAGVSQPEELHWVLPSGLARAGDHFVRLDEPSHGPLLDGFRQHGPVVVAATDAGRVIERLTVVGGGPIAGLEAVGWSDAPSAPEPTLHVRKPRGAQVRSQFLLEAEIRLGYGDSHVRLADRRPALVDSANLRLLRRDLARESELAQQAFAAGCSRSATSAFGEDLGDVQISRRTLPDVAAELIARGWRVEADGAALRRASGRKLKVKSGVDWFDLEARVEFGDESISLPELLAALARGERTVLLGDGSRGLLPEEWLARVAPLTQLGEGTDTGVRFRAQQALLLEALLASEPAVDADSAFRESCLRLERAGEPRPRSAAPGFAGSLREYQRAGLGWLHYLGEAGIGACLADDMGLGKTVQVLALLAEQQRSADASEARKRANPSEAGRLPSLVVAPSSVVPNWLAEAARFAPKLRLLDFTGTDRSEKRDRIGEHDLVVTSYGTLRAEIGKLADARFATLVLDEAQAIKNAASKTAKAARLLRAERRIALSGTPIENHLGELWSLFDFLNPGLLGGSARSVKVLDDLGEAGVAALAKAVRPFILRRTKQQVLAELPAKTEQTLVCELPPAQRRLYDELARYYRGRVLGEVERKGLARSKIHVLEALLRLRQAACHPRLVDPKRRTEGSAKLDLLMEQLEETLDEGHKALVFSQFTSLLALVRERLDAKGVVYEYLDGKTRDRERRVRRFQEDAACPLFLVSLKAGGLGLNLTAADTVYLLDPWWNPAVESQAIDRAHRIGQTQPVNAYRLVAKDTIEEKILALQERKKKLADAVISADGSVLRSLTREDLELLLG